jgi:hypothetical protein
MKEEIKDIAHDTPASMKEQGFFTDSADVQLSETGGYAFYTGTIQKTF